MSPLLTLLMRRRQDVLIASRFAVHSVFASLFFLLALCVKLKLERRYSTPPTSVYQCSYLVVVVTMLRKNITRRNDSIVTIPQQGESELEAEANTHTHTHTQTTHTSLQIKHAYMNDCSLTISYHLTHDSVTHTRAHTHRVAPALNVDDGTRTNPRNISRHCGLDGQFIHGPSAPRGG
jgi:hypothetical protein